jgi:hypothetical protein
MTGEFYRLPLGNLRFPMAGSILWEALYLRNPQLRALPTGR